MLSDHSPGSVEDRSDGIDIDSDNTSIGGDAVGRDKVVNAGRDVIIAQNVYVGSLNGNDLARPSQSTETQAPREPNAVNPFGYKGKITDPALYLVRQPMTSMVFDELRKSVSLSIVGDSQTGKSSLLLHIIRAGPVELNRPASDFAYVDMELIRTEDDFFEMLCEKLGVSLQRGFRLERSLRGRKIVLCLDEVEKMTWQGFAHDLRSELRGLADGADAPLTLIISSRTPLDRLFSDSAVETSPLGGLCIRIDMPPFSQTEAEALVTSLLHDATTSLPPAGVLAAWKQSAGHPARLQQALRDAFAKVNIP